MNQLSSHKELSQNHLFSGMTEEQLTKVIETISIVQLDEGELLFRRNDHAKHFYLVRSGLFKLYRLSIDGTEKVVDVVGPQQTFAEAIMFMKRQTYPVNAEALSESEVIAFDNEVFIEILHENVDTCFQVMADMSMRLRSRLNDIEALSLQNATLRFVSYLLQHLPEDSKDPSDIKLKLPKSVVASRLSVQPESLSRIFHNLTKIGLIKVEGAIIHVHDPEGLRNFVS